MKRRMSLVFTNRVANPCVRALLRSRFGSRAGARLALVGYHGRLTGDAREVVVQYARRGRQLWLLPAVPASKVWWRNFREPQRTHLRLAGGDFTGVATVVDAADAPDELLAGLVVYAAVFPQAARLTESARSVTGAGELVMVRVDLDVEPAGVHEHAREHAPGSTVACRWVGRTASPSLHARGSRRGRCVARRQAST